MIAEELLKPRYEVIADYPDSIWLSKQVLTVLSDDEDGQHLRSDIEGQDNIWNLHPELYPHLFKKLQWWEYRKIEEMPEYVKLEFNDKVQYVHKIERWTAENSYGQPLYEYHNKVNYLMTSCVSELLPAVEQEYLDYINKK